MAAAPNIENFGEWGATRINKIFIFTFAQSMTAIKIKICHPSSVQLFPITLPQTQGIHVSYNFVIIASVSNPIFFSNFLLQLTTDFVSYLRQIYLRVDFLKHL